MERDEEMGRNKKRGSKRALDDTRKDPSDGAGELDDISFLSPKDDDSTSGSKKNKKKRKDEGPRPRLFGGVRPSPKTAGDGAPAAAAYYSVDNCSAVDISNIAPEKRCCYDAFRSASECFSSAQGFTFRCIEKSPEARDQARLLGKALFAYDISDKNATSKAYLICDYRAFYDALILRCADTPDAHSMINSGRIDSTYEGLMLERPVVPYFDMEYSVKDNPEKGLHMADKMTRAAIRMLTVYLERFFEGDPALGPPETITYQDWIVLDSSNAKKVSRHAILRKPGLYFESLLDHALFCSIVMQDFNYRSSIKKNTLFDLLTVKRIVGGDAKGHTMEYVSFVDFAVYKEFQLFRCLKCHKAGDDRVLEVAAINEFRTPAYPAVPGSFTNPRISYEFFLSSLVGAVERNPSSSGGLRVKAQISSDILLLGYSALRDKQRRNDRANIAIVPLDEERSKTIRDENSRLLATATTSSSSSSSKSAKRAKPTKKNNSSMMAGNDGGGEDSEDPIESFEDSDGMSTEERQKALSEFEDVYMTILTGVPNASRDMIDRSESLKRTMVSLGRGGSGQPMVHAITLEPSREERIKKLMLRFIELCPLLEEWRAGATSYKLTCKAESGSQVPKFYILSSNSKWCPISRRLHTNPKVFLVFHPWRSVNIKCHSCSSKAATSGNFTIPETIDAYMHHEMWGKYEGLHDKETPPL